MSYMASYGGSCIVAQAQTKGLKAVPEIRGVSPCQGCSQLVLKQPFDSRPGSCAVKAGLGPRQLKPQEEGDVLRAQAPTWS